MVLPYIDMNPPWVYMCSPSWTPLPPPSPSHPSGSSQCTSPKHPVSCIEPGLAIHFIYDITHVSMPFSQTIPPSPSPTESKRLFYTSVSLLLQFHIFFFLYVFLPPFLLIHFMYIDNLMIPHIFLRFLFPFFCFFFRLQNLYWFIFKLTDFAISTLLLNPFNEYFNFRYYYFCL